MTNKEEDVEFVVHMSRPPKGFGKTQPLPSKKNVSSRDILVELALEKAVDGDLRERLLNGSLRAAVIDVPEGGWADPVGDTIESLMDDSVYVVSRSSVPKPRDVNDGMLLVRLQDGRAVVGVAPQPERSLPPLLLSISEATITIGPPDADLVTAVIKRCQTGAVPKGAKRLETGVLGFDELTSAIERKLGTAGPRKDAKAMPRLEDALEYGDARAWALALRDDIADLRKNLVAWEDVDRGCVLHGPPGTGKTLLARMLGEACGVSVVVSSLGEMFARSSGYLNDMIKELRAVFDEAQAKSPCILFLDELNALPNIDTVGERNKDYWAPLILDFYQLLDGATSDRTGVIVVGATNRIEDINPALLRPGRLERAIYVGPPDADGVERIMRHHLGNDLTDADIGKLAMLDANREATGAVVMEQVRAARRVARRAGRPMALSDLESEVVGADHRREDQLRRAAVHEAGHVVAGKAIGSAVESVSIISVETSGGSARMSLPAASLVTRDQLLGLVMSLLAGRAAEQLLLGEPSQGAGGSEDSDLARATAMVASMEASLGLGSSLVFRSNPDNAMSLLRDPEFRRRVEKILGDLYQRTLDILHDQRPALQAIVEALLERRFLTGIEVDSIIGKLESIPVKTERDRAAAR